MKWVSRLAPAAVPFVIAVAHAADSGRQAPYVPSPHSIVAEMLELAEVGPEDYLIDLGSGDGRIVLTAAKVFGARGLGVEIREDLVATANQAAVREGVADRVTFVQQDLFETDVSEATVVTMYLLPEMVNRLRDKLLSELDAGSRILSHDYPIEGWRAEEVVRLELEEKVAVTGVPRTNIYLYRVPADIAGRWQATVPESVSREPPVLEFLQFREVVQGRALIGERQLPLEEAELKGEEVAFTLPGRDARFRGRLMDGALVGTVEVAGVEGRWRATRADRKSH